MRCPPTWPNLILTSDSFTVMSITARFGGTVPNSRTCTWTANRSGRLMHLHGHVHDGAVNLTVDNASTGRRLCDSRAGYGESPAYIGHHGEPHISSMSICMGVNGAPIDTIGTGNRIQLEAHYTLEAPVTDAMGISIMYLAPA